VKKEERMKQISGLVRTILIAGLFISGLMFGAEAFAADQNPCSEDIAKFCKSPQYNRRAILECLERHESQLSDACKDYEARMENARMESREVAMQQMRVRQACKDDVSKFCKNVKPASNGTAACLKEHGNELSAPCKEALEASKGGAEERKTK
jgi:hypothetical protein